MVGIMKTRIPGYDFAGAVTPTIYEWAEKSDTCKTFNGVRIKKILLLRIGCNARFTYWTGYILNDRYKYMNLQGERFEVGGIPNVLLTEGTRVDDLKEFLKNTGVYNAVGAPKQVQDIKSLVVI